MKFKVDKNLPEEVCLLLNGAGHDALHVKDQGLVGCSDEKLFLRCRREARCLVTKDKGFSQVPSVMHAGMIVLRLEDATKPVILNRIEALVPELPKRQIIGQLWIVEPGRIRKRGIDTKPPKWR